MSLRVFWSANLSPSFLKCTGLSYGRFKMLMCMWWVVMMVWGVLEDCEKVLKGFERFWGVLRGFWGSFVEFWGGFRGVLKEF